jgi:isopentenyldiphosphate isomerase
MSVQQNDPGELLEVFDATGQPTGQAKPRAAIHLDGDWHLAFHCWILRRDGQEVVLQRRSPLKDTYPGRWDAAAAGHWRFGESATEAAREIAEELGIDVRFDDLVFRGREASATSFPNGLTDREFHEVYVLYDDRPLTAYRPDPVEVVGLAAFPLAELIEMLAGGRTSVVATEAVAISPLGAITASQVTLSRDQMVPYSAARLGRNLGRPDRVDTI